MADQIDHDYSTWFLAGCRDVLTSQSHLLAEGEQADVFEDAEKIYGLRTGSHLEGVSFSKFLYSEENSSPGGGLRASREPSPKLGWLGIQR